MNTAVLSDLADRIQQWMACCLASASAPTREGSESTTPSSLEEQFNAFAVELHAQQLAHNAAYRAWCSAAGTATGPVEHWQSIGAVPAAAFKEMDMTCLAPKERARTFCSSGTTGQKTSRHFHSAESLELYEASLAGWFRTHLLSDRPSGAVIDLTARPLFVSLIPEPAQAPNSSLAHMFETVQRRFGHHGSTFCGKVETDGAWSVDVAQAERAITSAAQAEQPIILLGTAFNYVHLLETCEAQDRQIALPTGSRLMETGGYKGRARSRPKEVLHQDLSDRLGLPLTAIVSEYGMSELSSQAYDNVAGQVVQPCTRRIFRFPPWARAEMISPETGQVVADGEAGLIRIWDLANVWSALAIQTEDMGIKRGHGFEWAGRAPTAEPRGCSLMAR